MDKQASDLISHLQRVIQQDPAVGSVDAFCDLARQYLAEFRPTQAYWENAQAGVVLSNGARVLISPPPSALRGTMASVAGRVVPANPLAQPDVSNQGAILVTTGRATVPEGHINYSTMDKVGVEDKTLPKPAEHLDQPTAYSRKP